MDPLDVGILRELSRDQVVWFGRLDPRLSAAEIARRLRVDRATVGSRLRAWERQGFLRGHEVVPSPLVFDAGIAGGNLRVEQLSRKPRILEDLSLIPGLISAVDHNGDWVALLYAFSRTEELHRSRRLIERLSGVGEVTPCVPFVAPVPTMVPTRLDFRILDDLKSGPRRTFAEIARSVHVSPKSLVRRMEQMARGRAVWYLPILDFTRYSKAVVARYVVLLKPGGNPTPIADRVARQLPGVTYLFDSSLLTSAEAPLPPMLDIGVHLDSIGQAEDVQREIGSLDGVEEVELLFPRRFYLYRTWFDDHIRASLDRSLGTATRAEKRHRAGARRRSSDARND
jgi:DNA-binding Lrp family transcriptional regulator